MSSLKGKQTRFYHENYATRLIFTNRCASIFTAGAESGCVERSKPRETCNRLVRPPHFKEFPTTGVSTFLGCGARAVVSEQNFVSQRQISYGLAQRG